MFILRFIRGLLVVGFATCSILSHASPKPMPLDSVRAFVAKLFPSIKVDVVMPSEAKSWFVVAAGDQIIYVNPTENLVFQGVLIDTRTRTNLTAQVKSKILSQAMRQFPFENAITYVNGNGSRHLIVFEDPYCKYCRSFTEEASTLTNISIHVILYPVLEKGSMPMAMKIWCSPDRQAAWHKWILNHEEPQNNGECANNPIHKNLELGRKYSVTGTPTIFLMNGQRLPGLPSCDDIEQALAEKSS